MKLKKLAWQSVVKIQNRRFIRANTSLKTFSDRVEISFYLHNQKLPFLFRCGLDGSTPHFVNLPYYDTYPRQLSQLPYQLQNLVSELRNGNAEFAKQWFINTSQLL